MASSPGTRKKTTLAAAIIVVLLLVIASARWFRVPERTPSPIGGQTGPVPTIASFTPAEPVPAGTPAVAPIAEAIPDAPVLVPAGNAFTTLEDYQQRRAAMPQKPAPVVPPPAGRTPETELGRVVFMVRDYRAAFGSNPVGSNKEITRTLLGDNERGTKFLDPSAVMLNAKGEMLDAWGHPYFFHAMSGKLMEIRSAGPDGRIFTADDLVQ